ncbi:conserved domain protein [Treponema primitia ZAS-2]|uniref:Conserved domain protein n=1 Tax=Treponema primitia (strain ATCC BAA-887 / DSM 12427 / ZAS-2) TaxID=545694 RepID=F5YP17_TREPZ|nr:conserved domain protein [Treponema primitia ZAS-2]
MKNGALIKILMDHGCIFVKHGKKHDVYKNPKTGITDRVPRPPDINEILAKHIIKNLS